MTVYANTIVEEVDDAYGCPTIRYRKPTDYAPGILVEDILGDVWTNRYDPCLWQRVPGGRWDQAPDAPWGLPLTSDFADQL
jgi:hypothetical protein